MRKSFFLAPILAASLAFACSSTSNRSGFETVVDPTEKEDAGRRNGFTPTGEEGNTTDDGGCSSSQTEIARTPVVIEFIVDQSGSMGDDDKWTAAQESLTAAFEDMKNSADPALFVGMALYSSTVGKKVVPKAVDAAQHGKLDGAINGASPLGGTSTKAGLEYGYEIVEQFKPPAAAGLDSSSIKRIVILLSDGKPSDAQPQVIEDFVAEKFAMSPPDGPIQTFSVGIGMFPGDTGYDPQFMSRVAQAGGTAPAGCDPTATDEAYVCHFQVTPGGDVTATKQALLDAINKIRALSASCEFTFKITGKDADPNNVKVTMTGADGKVIIIPKDPENGWSFDDAAKPTKVLLNGTSCSASNGTVSGRIDVELACKGAQ